jgi:hypothetical protein
MLGFLAVAALGEDIDAKGFKALRALFWGFFILCHCFFLFIYMAKIGGFFLLGGTLKKKEPSDGIAGNGGEMGIMLRDPLWLLL